MTSEQIHTLTFHLVGMAQVFARYRARVDHVAIDIDTIRDAMEDAAKLARLGETQGEVQAFIAAYRELKRRYELTE